MNFWTFCFIFVQIQYSGGLLNALIKNPIVTTKNGQIRGKYFPTPNGNGMYGFQGIPYAQPPLGKYKFQSTEPVKNWTGILDATSEGKNCIGSNYFDKLEEQSENCLYLNIYLPSLNNVEKLPVIFYIHGGRFVMGSSDMDKYGPGYLVDQEIVVVTFNYRLGPYGFLANQDLVIPGNAGLKDQLIALKWVNENIEAFGGDKSKITIMGHSAGGTSCGLHLICEKSKGLFRAAICQAGSAVVPWAVYNSPRKYTYMLANLINTNITMDTFNSNEVLEFLRHQSAANVMRAAKTIEKTMEKEDYLLAPCIEPTHDDAFLTENPYELLLNGQFNRVPLLIGIASEESLPYVPNIKTAKSIANKLDFEFGFVYPYDFIPKTDSDENVIQTFIKKIYLKKNQTFSDDLYNVVRFKSDDMFNRGTIKHALMQSKFTDVKFYQFSYSGGLNQYDTDIPGCEGKVGHGDVTKYVFANGVNYNIVNKTDKLIIQRMVTMVANFVKYLNPTPNGAQLILQGITWPKVEENNFLYLDIDREMTIKKDPKGDTFPKWTKMYERWGQKPFRTF